MELSFDTVATEHEYPALACGISEYDGLLVAYLPKFEATMDERADRVRGLTLYAFDGVLIDAIADDRRKVKWWIVRNAARDAGLAQIEPIWHGPAGEFKLSSLPDVPRPETDYTLHMRAYSHGPWIRLERKDEENVE